MKYNLINDDCVTVLNTMKKLKEKGQIEVFDGAFVDPPFGIEFSPSMGFYRRKDINVIDAYSEIESKDYAEFTWMWMTPLVDLIKDNGFIWVVSGWTNVDIIRTVAREMKLHLLNEIIWPSKWPPFNKTRFISSHYNVSLFVKDKDDFHFDIGAEHPYVEGKGKNKFNYVKRLDVWERLPRPQYRIEQEKPANMLDSRLVKKALVYTMKEGDKIIDPMMGSGMVGKIVIELGGTFVGIEKEKKIFEFAEKFIVGEI